MCHFLSKYVQLTTDYVNNPKWSCVFLSIIFDTSGFYGSYSENMEEKTAQFYLETQTEQKYEFAADPDTNDEILMLVM